MCCVESIIEIHPTKFCFKLSGYKIKKWSEHGYSSDYVSHKVAFNDILCMHRARILICLQKKKF